ncbi:heme-binding domain-containing protein [Chitinophaga sp. Mgbs1]|uniref:Heme-binding domain-containing protein n=1 Tax=Chitinophaga solisilvae TaxID=1233460 RepID=A0A3S1CTF4_9BACT|nr:heme-binding domain-containing protein [Chitinophaga solisilvae]
MAKMILLLLLLILIGIQFIRPARNRQPGPFPADISQVYALPSGVQQLLQQACYDCHSNQTHYPWYASVQPAGWFLQQHVSAGRRDLNFHEFAAYSSKRKQRKLKHMREQLISGRMPLDSYKWLHPEARLTTVQRDSVIRWIDSVLQ